MDEQLDLSEEVEIPEEEQEAALRAAYNEAVAALEHFDIEADDHKANVRQILQAFRAVRRSIDKSSKVMREKYGKNAYFYSDDAHIVASALMSDGYHDTHPYSMRGEFLLQFAMATKVLEAYVQFEGATDCELYDRGADGSLAAWAWRLEHDD